MKNCYLTNKIAKNPKQYSKKMIITYIKRKDLCGKGRDLRERERATAIMKKLFIRMRKQNCRRLSKQTYLCLYLYLTPFM